MGLSVKVTVGVLLTLVVVMAIGSYLMCKRQAKFFADQMKKEADILANSIGLGLSKLTQDQFNDGEYIQKGTEELGRITGINKIIVYDKDGVVIADTDRAWLGQKKHFEDVRQVLETKKVFSDIETMEGKDVYSKTFPIFIEKEGRKELVGIGEVSMDLEQVAKVWTVEQQADIFATVVELNVKKMMGDDIDTCEYIQRLTEDLGKTAGVYGIMLADKQLKILADTHPEEVGEIWSGEDVDEYRKVLATGEVRRYYEVMEGVKTFSATMPIYVEKDVGRKEIVGLSEVAMSVPYVQSLIASTRNEIILLTILTVFAISVITILLLRKSVIYPISSLAGVTKVIAGGDLSKRAEVKSRDEIGELATSFNQMTDEIQKRNEELQTMNEELRLTNEELETSNEELQSTTEELEASNEELRKTQEELIQKEKLAAVGQLASGVGHELRNPLGVIKNAVYYIKSKLPDDPKLQKHIAIMEREIANSNKIISDLLGFSRSRPPAINPQDINKVVEDTLEVVEIPGNVKLVKKLGADLPNAMADPDQIRQVFVNLSLNAIQAMSEGGQLTIATRRKDGFIEAEFADTGCGIVEENLSKLFDPFFTTRARGIGLGLAITQGIIERHNGDIEVKSEVEKGTTFVVKLPVEKKEV